MFWKRKKTDTNLVKENLVNFVFDNFLKANEDYTIAAEVNGTKLVKKVARWAYCDIVKGNIQALFSIETDKDVFCFQVQGEKISQIDSDMCSMLYPQLLPEEE